jgi:serine/threonine-protein kinase
MGEVYRALDSHLGRRVALKVLRPELAHDEAFRLRFLRESRLAASLDHPHVLPIYEAGETEGRLFIAMRYVEGTDLRRLLSTEGRLPSERALFLLAPVAGALDTAHAKGLVHRDVKPGNILIALDPSADPAEHVYLSDFGLTTASPERRDGAPFSGTADYAAPELVTGGPFDARTDVYALGCVLFECLTGTRPFGGESVMSVLWGHVNDPVPAASSRNRDLPEAVDGVLRKALAKKPTGRYRSCRELVQAAVDALGVTAVDVPFAARGRRALLVGAAAAALAAATLAGILLTRGGTEQAAGGVLVRIDPTTNRANGTVAIGEGPAGVDAKPDGVWVAAYRDGTLWRVDPKTLAATRVSSIGAPRDVATYRSRVYVAADGPKAFAGNVTAYDAANGRRIDGVELPKCASSIAAGTGGIWVAPCPYLERLAFDKGRARAVATITIASRKDAAHQLQTIDDIALGGGSLWVVGDAADRRLWRVDTSTARIVAVMQLPFPPRRITVGAGAVWVTDELGDRVARVDPAQARVATMVRVGRGASGVAFGAGSVWVTSFLDGTVSRIDPRTNRIVARIRVGGSPTEIAVGAGSVWTVGDAS